MTGNRWILFWVGLGLLVAGGGFLALGGGNTATGLGTTFGLAGVVIMVWAWTTRPRGKDER